MYFSKLFNGEALESSRRKEPGGGERQQNYRFCNPINDDGIKEALRKMTNTKECGRAF